MVEGQPTAFIAWVQFHCTVCPQSNFAADIKYHDFITIRRTLPSINHHKNSFKIVFSHLKLIVLLKMRVILIKTLIFGLWPKMKIDKKAQLTSAVHVSIMFSYLCAL